jgi:CMP-N-acetylneuraminic acid synthetase
MKTVAWMPIKLNNERLPGKNTKLLGEKPLLHYMLGTLLESSGIDEIYVFCSDEAIVPYLPEGVKFLKRDKSLDGFQVVHYDIVEAFVKEVDADIYLNAHATSPFIKKQTIEASLEKIKSGGYDSVCTVIPVRAHTWYEGEMFNFERSFLPRTQDLEPLMVEAGILAYKREVFIDHRSRYGDKPYLLEIDSIEAIDIDYPDDFKLAQAVVTAGLDL